MKPSTNNNNNAWTKRPAVVKSSRDEVPNAETAQETAFPTLGKVSNSSSTTTRAPPKAWGLGTKPAAVYGDTGKEKTALGDEEERRGGGKPDYEPPRRPESAPIAIGGTKAKSGKYVPPQLRGQTKQHLSAGRGAEKRGFEETEWKIKQDERNHEDSGFISPTKVATAEESEEVISATRRVWGSLRSPHGSWRNVANEDDEESEEKHLLQTRRVWGVPGNVREKPVAYEELERHTSPGPSSGFDAGRMMKTPPRADQALGTPRDCLESTIPIMTPPRVSPVPSILQEPKASTEEVLVATPPGQGASQSNFNHPRNPSTVVEVQQKSIEETMAEFKRASSIGLKGPSADSGLNSAESPTSSNAEEDVVSTSKDEPQQPMMFAMEQDNSQAAVTIPASLPKMSSKSKTPRAKDFDIVREIGVGAFGRVMLIKRKPLQTLEDDEEDSFFAMKILDKSRIIERNNEKYVMEEREILTKLSHPFIVSLKFAFQTRNKLYLIMEFLPGGELLTKIRKEGLLNEKQAMFYVGEIILALEYLHLNNIVHRDLKPENILLDYEGHIRLTDFGLARRLTRDATTGEDQFLKSICGTDLYMAPEMLAGKTYGKAVDFWALGCVFFEMLTGDPPFDANSRRRLYQLIMTKNPKFSSWMSGPCIKILKGLLDRNVEKRLGAARTTMFEVGGIAALKGHEFFKTLKWDMLEKKLIVPPLTPDIGGASDDAKKEAAEDGYLEVGSEGSTNDHFQGFSYVHPQFQVMASPQPNSMLMIEQVTATVAEILVSVPLGIDVAHPVETAPLPEPVISPLASQPQAALLIL